MAKAIDKAYLLAQLKGYDEKIAKATYVAQVEGKSLVLDTDIAKIAANETAIGNLKTYVGTIPEDAEASNVVAYIAEAISDAAYDDTEVRGLISDNADAIAVLNDADTVDGSVAKTVKDAINDFATKISDDGTINTFKELIDYAASHTAEFSELSGQVQANTTAIETLNGTGTTSVSGKISAAVGELGNKSEGVAYANVKDYVDTQISENATVFETTDIDFDTEW